MNLLCIFFYNISGQIWTPVRYFESVIFIPQF